jgi:hypothetical protein
MLYREIIAVCSEIHTKHINTLCGQNVELLNAKPGGTHSNLWAYRGADMQFCQYIVRGSYRIEKLGQALRNLHPLAGFTRVIKRRKTRWVWL